MSLAYLQRLFQNSPPRLGAGLLEAIAAIAIISIGLVTLVGLFAPVTKVQNITEGQQKATQLSQSAIEFFRKERDRLGWNEFIAQIGNGTFCLVKTENVVIPTALTAKGSTACATVTGASQFIREVVVSESPDIATISATTRWQEGDTVLYSTQSGRLNRWK